MSSGKEKYNLINERIDNVLIPILIFLSIIFGRDTLLTNVKYGFYKTQIFVVIVFLICIVFFLWNNRKSIKTIIFDIRFLSVFISSIIIILEMIIKQDYGLMNISVLLCIAISFFFSYLKDYKYLFRIIVNCIVFLSIYSLFSTYILREFIFSNINYFNIITNTVGSEFIDLIFAFVFNNTTYLRNFSVFREPAVFCYFLIMSLVFELFIINRKKRTKIFSIIILTFTIITTFSTTGMIILILIYFILFLLNFKNIWKNKKSRTYFVLILVSVLIALTIIVSLSPQIYWAIYSMVNKLTNINNSSFARFMSIPINITIYFSSPLFGIKISEVLTSLQNNTSTTFSLIATYGIFGFSNLIIWLFFVLMTFKNSVMYKNYFILVLYFFIIFIPFNTSNILTNIYFYIIPIVYLYDTYDFRNSKLLLYVSQKSEERKK